MLLRHIESPYNRENTYDLFLYSRDVVCNSGNEMRADLITGQPIISHQTTTPDLETTTTKASSEKQPSKTFPPAPFSFPSQSLLINTSSLRHVHGRLSTTRKDRRR